MSGGYDYKGVFVYIVKCETVIDSKVLPVCPVCELGYIGQYNICTNCGRGVPQGGSDGNGRMGKAVAAMQLPACCQSQGNARSDKG